MIALFVVVFVVILIIGLTAFIMALRDTDSWLHRRFNPNKRYADEGLSTEMADPEELAEITHGVDPIGKDIVE